MKKPVLIWLNKDLYIDLKDKSKLTVGCYGSVKEFIVSYLNQLCKKPSKEDLLNQKLLESLKEASINEKKILEEDAINVGIGTNDILVSKVSCNTCPKRYPFIEKPDVCIKDTRIKCLRDIVFK